MKILIYNWVPFDDPTRRGGGITKYLHDLIQNLHTDPTIQCCFLSSGLIYDFSKKARIEPTENKFGDRVKSFQVVNSPVIAPACMQFDDLATYLNDETLLPLLEKFWTQQGGFDVVHFHGLEGLPLSVLKLKETHPETKFYFSLHNYFLFCPQVNLWTNTEKNCYLENCYPNCTKCVTVPDSNIEKLASSTKKVLQNFGNLQNTKFYHLLKVLMRYVRNFSASKKQTAQDTSENHSQEVHVAYRTQNVAYANRYFDKIFAVSKQVERIAQSYGINPELLCTQYIGTTAASELHPPKHYHGQVMTLGYLGYARADKGFDMLLQALELLPAHIAQQLNVVLAAKCDTQEQYDKYDMAIQQIAPRFHNISFQNGYTKEEQVQLLAQIDIGTVPVLWEDNLPQVAIEYIANGVPILVSDCGGAKELCTSNHFVYCSRDIHSFVDKISELVVHPENLEVFWENMPKLTTMETHITALKQYYEL